MRVTTMACLHLQRSIITLMVWTLLGVLPQGASQMAILRLISLVTYSPFCCVCTTPKLMFEFLLIMNCPHIIFNKTFVRHTNSYIKANLIFETLLVSYLDTINLHRMFTSYFVLCAQHCVYVYVCVFF